MQPKTDVKFDRQSFDRIKRTIRNMSAGKRGTAREQGFATGLPDEVGIQLTHRCNLRCRHCFQWNEEGFFRSMDREAQNEDIDFDVVEKIFAETSGIKPNLYLWGGEPICYRQWDRLADLLEKDPRWTVFCTNGMDVEEKMDSILKISSNLAMLVSIEGFEKENDAIRGQGTYKKVMKGIDLLLELKKKGIYKGEVSVHCVISESMIGRLYDFMAYFEEKGVNTVYFCFPWYLSDETAEKMDKYFEEKFNWLYTLEPGRSYSWHSYKYHLRPELVEPLVQELRRINDRTWKIRVRYQPALEMEEVEDFILGREIPVQKRTKCLAASNRMNVLPDGRVTVCKLFPEFTIGDLKRESVYGVWNGSSFQRAREIIHCGLMPVCAKCVLLYLHGV